MTRLPFIVLVAALATACAQLPDAPLPDVPVTPAFKEQGAPVAGTAMPRPDWWTGFQDPDLNTLQAELLAASPDLGAALARYDQARAATDALRASQAPAIGASLEAARSRDSGTAAVLGVDLAYEVDLWGRVRQQVRAGAAEEQAAQADLASARLALQARLADTLLALRGLDTELALLRDTEAAYQRFAELTQRRQQGGIASGLDVARAQAQLAATRSQLRQVQGQRAVLEHGVAALVGRTASGFALQARDLPAVVPAIPTGVPSTLLQRRPDIAAAARRVTAANADVGVARAAYFPSLTLSATGGLAELTSAPGLFWAIGSTVLANVFDGGRRDAEVCRAQAVLDEAGQRYRGVVLAAFQEVEDQLALLARFGEAADAERETVEASGRALELASRRYEQGAHLDARRSAVDLATRQRRAAVQLLRALGGGWSA